MFRGLYTGASGMLGELVRVDVISNNLANSSTVGYKRDQAVFRSYPEVFVFELKRLQDPHPVGSLGTGVFLDQVVTPDISGPFIPSDRALDIAVKNGYLVVETPQGERYTKNGRLLVNNNGYLVTSDGYRVLGERGPIFIGQGEPMINQRGEVILNNHTLDTLRVVNPQQGVIEKIGNNLLNFNPTSIQPYIEPFALENSNVNTVREMVELISAYRAYESNQKVIQAEDGITDRLISDLGRF
ncbi:MAG: flagellar hook-basal body protein [bacterium]